MWHNQSNIQVRIFAFACSQRSQPRSLKQIDIQKMLLYFQLDYDYSESNACLTDSSVFRLAAIYIGFLL